VAINVLMVFQDEKKCICEECSLDFEQIDGVVQFRKDLVEQGYVEPVFQIKGHFRFR